MSLVTFQNIEVLNNPAKFTDELSFNITFELNSPLKDDVEFKLTYVGSPNSEAYDQTLESILVGPIPVGVNQFIFSANAPIPEKIPHDDVLGITAILLTCSYQENEFIRIGYYVNNEYENPELNETPPLKHDYQQIIRNILVDKPRVTKYRIQWDDVIDDKAEFQKDEKLNNENIQEDDVAMAMDNENDLDEEEEDDEDYDEMDNGAVTEIE